MKTTVFIRIAVLIITAYFFFSGLFYLQQILVPMLFAAFLAMLVLPLCKFLEKKLSRGLAIGICLIIIMGVVSGMFALLYAQIVVLAEDFPLFRDKAMQKFDALQLY